ncbi:hypothetical protein BaRGS_00020497 [Batillaria attramentaria]|uniref:AD domain-containing protein n=1 Tax=Batillaria attramentaria TaxID=370345 RepID=A0ABD0KN67_9CAEN
MRFEMADNSSEYFTIGSQVRVTTCHNVEMKGEVVAFDVQTKFLLIKSPSVGRHNTFDMKAINLDMVSELSVLSEPTTPPPPLGNLNMARVQTRLRQNMEEKKRQLNYVGVDVTPEGQRLMNSISKTIQDVRWDTQNIVVMDAVVITPPYRLEDCKMLKENSNSQTLAHIRKIMEKHQRDETSRQAQPQNDSRKSMSPSPAPSSSPASSTS